MSPEAERALAQIRQDALLCPIDSPAYPAAVAVLRHFDSAEPCDFLAAFASLTSGGQAAVIELLRQIHRGEATVDEVNGYPLPANARRPRSEPVRPAKPAIWVSLLPKPRQA